METTTQRDIQTKHFQGPGGTPGGVGTFLLGLAMTVAGGYLILNQVQVTSGFWYWWGPNTFGLTLVPLMIGIGLLFFNGKSLAGRLLVGTGLVIIFAGIIANLNIYFHRTSLFNVLIMLALLAGGLGLIVRSLRSYESKNESPSE
jgi:multisubunit Na+/H+ antiporter MnhF subunit